MDFIWILIHTNTMENKVCETEILEPSTFDIKKFFIF